MSQKVVTFGEIMLRLKSPGYERFFQSPVLEATFGGGEANVSVSLANYGMETAFVTVLPNNDIGDACIRELRGFSVDTSKIVRREGRMGIYYLETGAVQRPSKVIYDRAGSAICNAKPGDIDWASVFEGASWFHITGITPAISAGAAELSLEAVQAAKKLGLHVSCDLNYRKNLWKYGKTADQVMTELVRYVDTVIANEEDFQKALLLKADSVGQVEEGQLNVEQYKAIARLAMETYPNIQRVAITLRESKSANHNDWSACLYNGKDFFLLIDCGANVDCRPEYLHQFAQMGTAYMQTMRGVANPRVGLVNNGAEAEKGCALTKAAYEILSADEKLNFVGNVEAREITHDSADVIVCDGFVGNVILKFMEGVAGTLMGMIKREMLADTRSKIGALLAKPAFHRVKKAMDYSEVGGAPLLGVSGNVVKAHGSCNAHAFACAIHQAEKMVTGDVVGKIEKQLVYTAHAE